MSPEDVFTNEKNIFCSICGKEITKECEVEEELCLKCLNSLLDEKDE